MGLFIAINFDDEVKDMLLQNQYSLEAQCLHGDFIAYENLHLTLIFLGKVNGGQIKLLHQIMDSVTVLPFRVLMKDMGFFERKGGDTWWMGIEEHKQLTELYRQLYTGLGHVGFTLEQRKFVPHITFARKVQLREDFDQLRFSHSTNVINAGISKIGLMNSECVHEKRVYEEIYAKAL